MNDNDAVTHEVTNQPPRLEDYDGFEADPWLAAAVERAGIADIADSARALGQFVGSAEGQRHAELANRHGPELRSHDRFGHRVDEVEYHPSYHALMERAIGAGIHSIAWQGRQGAFSAHATCFFVRRSLADGSRNPFLIQRLKDQCGNRSNASAEIEYRGPRAWLVGEPGRGIATLIEMAHHTRFDIVVGVAGMMRAALNLALHHAQHRQAFGRRLAGHPLMANVLADLALEA